MEKEIEELREQLAIASGQSAAMNLLVMALVAQAPDKGVLLRDFDEMSDETTVRAMYSSMPEAFFQSLQQAVAIWREQIDDANEQQRADGPRGW